jgi:hypothetical protein
MPRGCATASNIRLALPNRLGTTGLTLEIYFTNSSEP